VCDGAFQRAGRQVPAFEFGDLRLGEAFDVGGREAGYVVGRETYIPVCVVDIEAVLEHANDPVNFFGSRCGSLMEDEDALDPRPGGVRPAADVPVALRVDDRLRPSGDFWCGVSCSTPFPRREAD